MDNTVEAPATRQLVPDEIRLSKTAAAVIFPLAIYGGQDLTRKAISKSRQIIADRKTKQAAKKTVEPTDTPSQ